MQRQRKRRTSWKEKEKKKQTCAAPLIRDSETSRNYILHKDDKLEAAACALLVYEQHLRRTYIDSIPESSQVRIFGSIIMSGWWIRRCMQNADVHTHTHTHTHTPTNTFAKDEKERVNSKHNNASAAGIDRSLFFFFFWLALTIDFANIIKNSKEKLAT